MVHKKIICKGLSEVTNSVLPKILVKVGDYSEIKITVQRSEHLSCIYEISTYVMLSNETTSLMPNINLIHACFGKRTLIRTKHNIKLM